MRNAFKWLLVASPQASPVCNQWWRLRQIARVDCVACTRVVAEDSKLFTICNNLQQSATVCLQSATICGSCVIADFEGRNSHVVFVRWTRVVFFATPCVGPSLDNNPNRHGCGLRISYGGVTLTGRCRLLPRLDGSHRPLPAIALA